MTQLTNRLTFFVFQLVSFFNQCQVTYAAKTFPDIFLVSKIGSIIAEAYKYSPNFEKIPFP